MVKIWTSERPMPDIPTLHGLTHNEYKTELTRYNLSQHDGPDCRWTIAITDPRNDWYGGVITAVNHPVRWFVGNADGVTETSTTQLWPWEAVDSVQHVITCSVFRLAHAQGALKSYWTEAI